MLCWLSCSLRHNSSMIWTTCMQVSVVHCSAGIEYIPAQSVVMDPAEVTNLTFVLYSFHSISQVNHCEGVCVFTYVCCVHGHYPFNRHLLYIRTVHIYVHTYTFVYVWVVTAIQFSSMMRRAC